jgi:GNAT superfamily N-acetyltransferase
VIHVIPDRKKAIKAGYESLKDRIRCHPEEFESLFRNFEMQAFCEDDIPIGMCLIKGPELHVSIIPSYRRKWLSRKLINSVIDPILNKYGYVMTMVMKDNPKGIDFVERLGFKRQFENEQMIYYRKTHESSYQNSH